MAEKLLEGSHLTWIKMSQWRRYKEIQQSNKDRFISTTIGGASLASGAVALELNRYNVDLAEYNAKLMRSGSTKQVNRVSKVVATKLPTLPERIAKFTTRVPALIPVLGLIAVGLAAKAVVDLNAFRHTDLRLEDIIIRGTKRGTKYSDAQTLIDDLSANTVDFPFSTVPTVDRFQQTRIVLRVVLGIAFLHPPHQVMLQKSHPIAITEILDHLGSIITEQPNEQNISKGSLLKCLPSPSNEPQCTPI